MISSTLPPKPDIPPAAALNPNITIKEITKPTEIRITDENKAKPIHQMLKLSTTTTTTTSTTEAPQSSAIASTDAPTLSSTTATILTLVKDPESELMLIKNCFAKIALLITVGPSLKSHDMNLNNLTRKAWNLSPKRTKTKYC